MVVWAAVDDAGFATVVVVVAAVAIAADLVGIRRQSEGMDLSWVFAAVQDAAAAAVVAIAVVVVAIAADFVDIH